MTTLDLGGTWEVRQQGETTAIPATVPGCIHTDLLAAGKIDDPYYRDNEARQMWIGETAWVYSRAFTVDAGMLQRENVILHCDGLDTLATITINGAVIGQTDNQFRVWEFDVKPYLRAGNNTITVCFDSTLPLIQAEQQKRYLNLTGVGHHRVDGSNRIRKSQCNYGWDWGPICVTAGIWRPIEIRAFETGRIADVLITQDHSQRGQVALNVTVNVEQIAAAALTAKVAVWNQGALIAQADAAVTNGAAHATLTMTQPQLWWPNGMGAQPLYEVSVDLQNGATRLEATTKRIGLRTLTLDRHADQWGESFQFVVNGQPFFAKGANWIPADTFVTRITRDWYDGLLKSAVAANMNMLRVWGGGIYEAEMFYELCDAYGICIWQDLMFACSAYPAFDDAYLANVRQEIADNVKQLRHHPAIAFWCGNNELEHIHQMFLSDTPEHGKMTWDEYKLMFDQVIPDVVHQHDPERTYWPSSGHSPLGDRKDPNNPACGDAHLWEVWHGRLPFEWYRTCQHRFISEFGFQAFPEPAVVNSYTLPDERNVTSYMMEWHQRSQIGNDAIVQYMLSWFQLPTSFDMFLWTSQILQGIGIKYALEPWRRGRPRTMGGLYWQINDCWPVASWSSIDYYGNWKALHYMARDFFAPLLLSALEDTKQGTVEVHVTSDLMEATAGTIHWVLSDTAGKILAENNLACSHLAPQADTKVCLLEFTDHLKAYGNRKLLVWLELLVNGKIVSRNFATFNRPKHLELLNPALSAQVQDAGNGAFAVTIAAKHPALWVWPELKGVQATYSDRFFHLFPGKPQTVQITPAQPMSQTKFARALTLASLFETYQPVV